jgi:hypothetical protein
MLHVFASPLKLADTRISLAWHIAILAVQQCTEIVPVFGGSLNFEGVRYWIAAQTIYSDT